MVDQLLPCGKEIGNVTDDLKVICFALNNSLAFIVYLDASK